MKRVKVAVSGGAGNIGYALLFRIASGQMFGSDTEIELQLLEVEQALTALEGVKMELDDCAFPLLKKVTCSSDENTAMKDADWVLLVGSVPRKAGMERSDLLKVNGNVFTKQGKAINDNASRDVKVFVVGNPCNTNALIAMNNAPDIPNERFFAMTMLDENRAVYQLANKAGVSVTEVENMIVWGNHSQNQYPNFYEATIQGRPAIDVIQDEPWLQGEFIKTVQQRGAAIIQARGASSAASAASSVIDSVYNLTHETPEGKAFSVSLCSNGEYGIDKGLIFSYPVRVVNGEVEIIKDVEFNAFSRSKIDAVHEELREERDTVKQLGMI